MVNSNVRTSERFAVILFLILLLMVVYQNCGMPMRVTDSTVHKLTEGDIKVLLALDPGDKQSICENSSFYSCEHTDFTPDDPSSGVSKYTRCTDLFGNGERFCAMISYKIENTSELLQACTTCSVGDAHTGGRFNREEFRCWNHMVRDGEVFTVAAVSDSLEETLSRAVASCRDVLQY